MTSTSRYVLLLALVWGAFHSALCSADDILKPAPLEASSPREDLRKQVFEKKQLLDKRACETLATDPAATIPADQYLQETIRELIKSINNGDEKTLRDQFNARLKVKAGQVALSLASLKKIVGSKYAVTNFRVFALNSPDGSTGAIPCQDTGVLIHPLYGYPLSAGVWLQATGDNEVARIFLELVPAKKDWTIGAWHIQQWTHAGKDFSMWQDMALAFAQKGHKEAAFITSDLAAKLLDGGGFLEFPVMHDAETWRDKQMTTEAWTKSVRALFPQDEIVHLSTLFVKGGAGVIMRFSVKAELSTSAIKDHCKAHLQKIVATDWGDAILGIRCGYNFLRENPRADGILGSIYVSKEDLKEKDKS